MTKITYIPGEIANAAIDEHGNRKPVTRTHHIFDDTKNKNQAEVNAEVDDTFALHQSEINALNSQNYVTVDSFSSLPATGAVDTVYRVSNWNGTQQDPSVYSEYAWNGEDYIHLSTKTQIGEVFDISAYHATGGELAKYADLAAALGTNGANIPDTLRKGGMSVKFVHTSDNKYVQYRYMEADATTTATFTNVANWQGVDEEPKKGSKNLIESNAVALYIEQTSGIHTIEDIDATANTRLSKTILRDLVVGKKYVITINSNDASFSQFGVLVGTDSSIVDNRLYWQALAANTQIKLDYTHQNNEYDVIKVMAADSSVLTSGTLEVYIDSNGRLDDIENDIDEINTKTTELETDTDNLENSLHELDSRTNGFHSTKDITATAGSILSKKILENMVLNMTYKITIQTNSFSSSLLGILKNGSTSQGDKLYYDAIAANESIAINYTHTDSSIQNIYLRSAAASVLTSGTINVAIDANGRLDEMDDDIEELNDRVTGAETNINTLDVEVNGYNSQEDIVATVGTRISKAILRNMILGNTYVITIATNDVSASLIGVVKNLDTSSSSRLFWDSVSQNSTYTIVYRHTDISVEKLSILCGNDAVLTSGTLNVSIKSRGVTDELEKLKGFIIVDINGKGDYTSLQDAINNAGDTAQNPKTIIVLPGKYEMPTKYSGIPAAGNRYLSIIGTDKNNCILFNKKGNYRSGSSVDDACLQLGGNCYIANLTIISSSEEYVETTGSQLRAYCLHLDANAPANSVLEVNNCILKNDHSSCLGIGLRSNYTVKVINCEIDAYLIPANDDLHGAVYCHDSDVDGNQTLVLRNNIIVCNKYAVRISTPYNKTITCDFSMNVCKSLGSMLSNHATLSDLCYGNNVASMNKT